jgi:PKHD-type hydroxylase
MVLDKKPPYIRLQSGWFEKNKDKIIKEFESLVEEGTTVGGNKNEKRKSDVHLFDIWRLELSDFKKVIIFKVKEIFTTENKNYGFDLDYSTINVQFTRYQKDDFYEWHSDDDMLNTHIKTHSIRKLSMSIPLNVGEYEGGEIEIKLSPNDNARIRKIPAESGNVIVFPSFLEHRVLPVISNTRYSLVAWISGPPWR